MNDGLDDQIDDQKNDRRRNPSDDLSDDEIIEVAKSRVKGPAIALMVLGILSFGIIVYSVYSYVFLMPGQIEEAKQKIEARPDKGKNPESDKAVENFMDIYFTGVKIGTPIAWVLIFITSCFVILSGMKLLNLESPGMIKFSSIMSMLPCVSGCCLIGIPIGIWVLITMGNVDVKDGFAVMKRRKSLAH